jgi:hypothetical protein
MPSTTTVIPENQIVIETESDTQAIEIKIEEDAAQYYAEQAQMSAASASASAASALDSKNAASSSASTASTASETAVSAKDTAVASGEPAVSSAADALLSKESALDSKNLAYYYYQQTEILAQKATEISEGMTLAEYEAMPESQKMDGTVWFITDVCSLDDGDLEDF